MKLQSSSVLVVLVLYLFGDSVGEEDRRLNLTFSSACGAYFLDLHLYGGTHPLPRDLHQTELTERQHVMLGAVTLHEFAYVVVQLLLMPFVIHIDEIDDDDSAYIP